MKIHIEDLIARWRDGNPAESEVRRLAELLEDPEARDALRDEWFLEAALPEALRRTAVLGCREPELLAGGGGGVCNRWKHWLSWRPLTAAAAGIAFGMLFTTIVFGYSTSRFVQKVLTLANAGFEEPDGPLPDGVPLAFGVWSGDHAATVGREQGVTPLEGGRMFRFLRSDSGEGLPSRARHGNMYQLIDIRPWRDAIACGKAVVDWSAGFNCIREEGGVPSQFEASMWAFSGPPSVVRRNWEEKLHLELGYSTWRAVADGDPGTWQRVNGRLIVPPETDFLVIEIKAIAGNEGSVDGPVSFGGHYADDVRLVLRTDPREQPQRLKRAHP